MRKVILPNLKSLHMFENQKILITGGTGSLGTALTARLLKTNVDTIRIFSRDELKQSQMESHFNDKRLRFLIGDVRDKERLEKAVEYVNIVIHTAALKQVPVIEYNPFEAIKTNVQGSQNLVDACLEKDVEFALAIGTDKAVSPFNTYGATKLLMERLFVSANYHKGAHKTKFSCVRYGNVLGSRGSVIPLWDSKIKKNNPLPVTHPDMTRFMLTLSEAIHLVFYALDNAKGGEIFVKKAPATKIVDLAKVYAEIKTGNDDYPINLVGRRAGEKIHEVLVSEEEMRNVNEKEDHYIINRELEFDLDSLKKERLSEYSSDTVPLITKSELKNLMKDLSWIP